MNSDKSMHTTLECGPFTVRIPSQYKVERLDSHMIWTSPDHCDFYDRKGDWFIPRSAGLPKIAVKDRPDLSIGNVFYVAKLGSWDLVIGIEPNKNSIEEVSDYLFETTNVVPQFQVLRINGIDVRRRLDYKGSKDPMNDWYYIDEEGILNISFRGPSEPQIQKDLDWIAANVTVR